ncbi:MAG: hypothetical protein F4X32_03880 [Candidatus Dadabacteria bacterium]|nr:hypothetical protein [Candidatus Dadabacteria bacterium]
MKNPYIEYIEELQAQLEAISQPHNEIRALGRILQDIDGIRETGVRLQKLCNIDLPDIGKLQRETMEQLNHTLSLLPTPSPYYTRVIEDEEEGISKDLESKEDFMLLFGDME